MKRTSSTSRKIRAAIQLETLESRQLMSASPYVINGTSGNDVITVNYGFNPVFAQSTTASASTTGTSTTAATGTSGSIAKAAVSTVSATQAIATQTITPVTSAVRIVTIPTIFNQLTVTINGVSSTTTLGQGQTLQVNGLAGNDKITVSGSAAAVINGGDGNDSLIGGSGADILNGGNGNDVLDGGFGADVLNGGAGTDTADYSSRLQNVSVFLDGAANDGQAGEGDNVSTDIEIINGGLGNDVLVGNANDTVARQFYGNLGNDSITGGAGNDLIHGGAGDDLENGGAGNDVIYGDAGYNTEYGGDGNDRLYGGSSVNFLHGGNGDDILVSIGGSHIDRQWGDAGLDSFWLDAETTECTMDVSTVENAMHNIHRVAGYEPLKVSATQTVQPSREMYVGNLPDPVTTVIDAKKSSAKYGYKNFSNVPLFTAAGPVANDVNQGNLGDCYFMAPLSSTAKICQNQIRQSVVDLGDGTYAVQLRRDGVSHFVRVDADLPVNSSGNLEYAHWGPSGQSLWAPIMEKAWAFFRNSTGTYAGTESGQATETFKTLGMSNDNYNPNGVVFGIFGDSPQEFGQKIMSLMAGGNAVTLCTPQDGGFLVNSHCYLVDHVNTIGSTVVSIVLRNPWGNDGTNPRADGNNDGYVTVDATEALASCDHLAYGHT